MEYFRQKYVYTCGPASLRMVFNALGIKKSREWMICHLKANTRVGTRQEMLAYMAEKFKLDFRVHRNYNVRDVHRLLGKGYYIIVCYMPPEEKFGHYAVVRKVSRKWVILHDPWYGPDFKIPRKIFQQNWKDSEGNKGWLIAIRRS